MSPARVFRSQMAALAAQDVERVIAHFAPDCRLVDMATPGRPHVGVAALRRFLIEYFETWSLDDVAITSLLEGGDVVAAEVALSVSPVSGGMPRVLRSCLVDEVQDGLIVCERAYRDPAGRSTVPSAS